MKKYIASFTIAVALALTNSASAQDIATVINNAQKNPLFETLAPVLSQLVFSTDSTLKTSKGNPVDTSVISIKGALGVVKRTAKSKDYIAIETSKAGKIEAKLLPLINDSKIVCIIKTVCGTFCDSQVFFYTTDWEPIDAQNLIPTKSIDWFIDRTAIPAEKLEEVNALLADISPTKFSLNPTNMTMAAESDIENFLGDRFKIIEPYFTKEKMLTWNKISFK